MRAPLILLTPTPLDTTSPIYQTYERLRNNGSDLRRGNEDYPQNRRITGNFVTNVAEWTPANLPFVVRSITGFQQNNFTLLRDNDHSNLDLVRISLHDDTWSASTEINILSDKPIVLDLGGGGVKPQFEWIIGGNYWHETIRSNTGRTTIGKDLVTALRNTPFNPLLGQFGQPDAETDDLFNAGFLDVDAQIQHDNGGIFGEGSVEMSRFKLTGGVRYSSITREFVQFRNHPLVEAGNLAAAQGTVALTAAGAPIPANLPSLADAQAALARTNPGTLCAPENGGCERTWESVTWKVALQYDVPDDLIPFVDPLAYFIVSTGNRPGGYNFSPDDDFEEEDLLAIEAGIKNSLWDKRIEFNIGGFFYMLEDAQISQVFNTIPTVDNIPEVEMYGIEIEMRAEPITGMRVNFGFGWQESEVISDYCANNQGAPPPDSPDPGCEGMPGRLTNIKGNGLPRVPQFNISFGTEYEYNVPQIQGSVTGRIDVVWRDDINFYQFENPQDVQKAYALVDLRLRYQHQSGNFGAEAYVENVGDEDVIINSELADVINRLVYLNEPRTYGIKLFVRY